MVQSPDFLNNTHHTGWLDARIAAQVGGWMDGWVGGWVGKRLFGGSNSTSATIYPPPCID
jgi:hypothetical protein